ncbi:diacylglycerol/lipid kinase family protein [Faecalicoccus pleomorphus]|uniref:diacylglycerol/lipid kinase family protein n=1 Tax=Faecalicoccus pleomorphus TaxID=1323 RepID=UPI0039F5FAD8
MKDVFIINPYSGKKEQYALMQQIKENFQGKRIIIEKTKNPGHAQFIAQKYALKTEEEVHLFVCGGDGTLHEVVNGMAGAKHVYLSVLPTGTGNDFIKSFPALTAQDFLNLSEYENPVEMECDLLKVNGEYVLNTASIGFDVHVADYANKYKKYIPAGGIIPYYMGMLASLRKPLGHTYRIQIDEDHLPEEKYTFLVFANGQYYGGGYRPCPNALLNDGMMDICLIKDVKRTQIVSMAKLYEKGEHVHYPELAFVSQGTTCHVDTENKEILMNLDGEVRPVKNPTIEIVPKAIRLLLPSKTE